MHVVVVGIDYSAKMEAVGAGCPVYLKAFETDKRELLGTDWTVAATDCPVYREVAGADNLAGLKIFGSD